MTIPVNYVSVSPVFDHVYIYRCLDDPYAQPFIYSEDYGSYFYYNPTIAGYCNGNLIYSISMLSVADDIYYYSYQNTPVIPSYVHTNYLFIDDYPMVDCLYDNVFVDFYYPDYYEVFY